MGMAQVELVGTEAVYYVDGREICRQTVSSMTGIIEVPPIVFAAAGSRCLNITVSYRHFDHRAEFVSRSARRGKKFKHSYGPQTQWWNKR